MSEVIHDAMKNMIRIDTLRIGHLRSSLLVLIAILSGCLDASSTSAPSATSIISEALQSCSDNCDCAYGQYCARHQCFDDFGPLLPCYCAARDCAAGQVCDLSSSVGGGFCTSSCTDDCDCEYGNVCSNGHCEADFGPFPPCYCAARDCTGLRQNTCQNGFCATDTRL